MSFTGQLTGGIMAKAGNPFNLRFGNGSSPTNPTVETQELLECRFRGNDDQGHAKDRR
jgi:hypothetical protein